MSKKLKIDMHIHTRLHKGIERLIGSEPDGTYASPEEIREMYKTLGIKKGVILPGIGPYCSYHIQSNEEAHFLTQLYPDLFYWFCNIDPRFGGNSPDFDLSYFLEHYKKLGAKGVGEVCTNMRFDNPFMENLFHHTEKCNLPLIFHIAPKGEGFYGIIDDLGLPGLEGALNKFPQLIFLGHSQPFWAEISADVTDENRNGYPTGKVTPGRVVELMEKYPNLHGDLSAGSGFNAISRDPDFGYEFLERFSDRLYFATDICDPRNKMMLSSWLDDALEKGRLSEEAYDKICFENALKILEG